MIPVKKNSRPPDIVAGTLHLSHSPPAHGAGKSGNQSIRDGMPEEYEHSARESRPVLRGRAPGSPWVDDGTEGRVLVWVRGLNGGGRAERSGERRANREGTGNHGRGSGGHGGGAVRLYTHYPTHSFPMVFFIFFFESYSTVRVFALVENCTKLHESFRDCQFLHCFFCYFSSDLTNKISVIV